MVPPPHTHRVFVAASASPTRFLRSMPGENNTWTPMTCILWQSRRSCTPSLPSAGREVDSSLHRSLPHGHLRRASLTGNAHELTYCAKGSSLVTVFSNGNLHDTFTIAQGEMFFVPSGYSHAIANTGGENAEFSSPSLITNRKSLASPAPSAA